MSIDRGMDKEDVAHIMQLNITQPEKGMNCAIHREADGLRGCHTE